MLWTAPENITNYHRCPRGSREGDVYGFGIILHEVFYRLGPFAGWEDLSVKGETCILYYSWHVHLISPCNDADSICFKLYIYISTIYCTTAIPLLRCLCWLWPCDILNSTDIIDRVQRMNTPPVRPLLFAECLDVCTAVTDLMQMCWHDNEKNRPTFSTIKSYMKQNIDREM